MPLPRDLMDFRLRPGMYLMPIEFGSVVSFVCGYDLACEGGVLWGFREWLVCRLGRGNDLAWPALVVDALRADPSVASALGFSVVEDHRVVIDGFWRLLDEFFTEKDARGGACRIFVSYDAWLRGQSWYRP